MAPRCPRCFVHQHLCFCALLRPVRARLEVVLVRHARERKKSSNTGRIAALALAGTRTLTFGAPGEPWSVADLACDGAALLWPEPGATWPAAAPSRLIVLDGTWSQARKMRQRIPALRALPCVAVPVPAAPLPKLRRPPRAGHLSTLEAIVAALAAAGDGEAAEHLTALHAEQVRRLCLTGRFDPAQRPAR